MVESVTAPLAIGIIAFVILVMALGRALRRRRASPRDETRSSPTRSRADDPRSRKAG